MGGWHDLHPARALQGPQRERKTDAYPNHHRVADNGPDRYSTDHYSTDDSTHHNSTGHDGPNYDHSASHNHRASAANDDHCATDHIGSHGYGYAA